MNRSMMMDVSPDYPARLVLLRRKGVSLMSELSFIVAALVVLVAHSDGLPGMGERR